MVKNSKTGHLTLTTPLLGIFHRQGETCYGTVSQRTKFEASIGVQHLKSLALAVAEKLLGV